MNSPTKLKVMEAVQDDVNKGIVKIDSSFMKEIGVNPGDIVEVKGERSTAAMVDRAYPGDIGLNIIRMDGNSRRNARTSIGEMVTVIKANIKPAKKVSIAPAHKGMMIRASPQLFKQGLLGKAVLKGDLVSLGRTRKRTFGRPDDEMMSMMQGQFPGFGFGDIKFMVIDTLPKKELLVVNQDTEVEFNPQAVELKEEEGLSLGINYEDIGGLGEEIKNVREMIELPLKHPEIFEKLGIEPPKGVLLHGPPGTGKTLLAKAVASETNTNFILINGPEVMSKFYGESEANLRKKFEEAEKNAPSIIFFDEIDAIATKREETRGEVEKRVVAQLLGLMDGLKSRGKVVVIAATNMPNSLDPALRRPGRFDREIEIGVPDKNGRREVLQIHTRNMPLNSSLKSLGIKYKKEQIVEKLSTMDISSEINEIASQINSDMGKNERDTAEPLIDVIKKVLEKKLKSSSIVTELYSVLNEKISREIYSVMHARENEEEMIEAANTHLMALLKEKSCITLVDDAARELYLLQIAKITHGFVGADLNALAKEAAMIVLRRILPDLKKAGIEEGIEIPKEILEKIIVDQRDFIEALKVVRPSAMREVLVETPDVSWEDVGGLDDVKSKLKEAVEWPLKTPEAFKRMGIRPPRGVLLYGPPGTGKTLLAKAVAKESESNFILVNGPSLLSKWVGESEKAVREIFRKARQTSPTVLFFDEIDALAPKRTGNSNDSNTTERIVNQLLTEMDGLESLQDVVVIAATNRPDMVDTALLRQGRFDRVILTLVPDDKSRKNIFEIYLNKMLFAKDVDSKKLAERSEGYVGADIEGVCREAAMEALRENIKATEVTMKHFDLAFDVVKASVDNEIKEAYDNLASYFSSARAKEIVEDKHGYVG